MSIAVQVQVLEQTGTEDIARCIVRDDRDKEISAVVPAGSLSEGMTGYVVAEEEHVYLFDGHGADAERLV